MKIIAVALLVMACGCAPEYPHRYKKGDMVRMKIDGREGMVMSAFAHHGTLSVRFAGDKTTGHVGLLGGTVSQSKSPYSVIYVKDWELE